jgi:hypothetical protein
MSNRLLPFAVLVVFASLLTGGVMIIPVPGATTASTALSETSTRPTVARAVASMASPLKPAMTISSARPPVPLLRSRRAAQFAGHSGPHATTTENTATEIQEMTGSSVAMARAMIEADGYRNVEALVKTSDGIWRGLAQRGATEVAVSLDTSGRVSAQ